MDIKNLVALSIYDSGYTATFMENEEIIYLDNGCTALKKFKERFGKEPYKINSKELAKHYSSDYIIVLCEDGCIEYSRGTKDESDCRI